MFIIVLPVPNTFIDLNWYLGFDLWTFGLCPELPLKKFDAGVICLSADMALSFTESQLTHHVVGTLVLIILIVIIANNSYH